MSRDRQKSPAEIAALKAEIQKQKEIQHEKDAKKTVGRGRIIIFVLAGFMVLSAALEYNQLNGAVEVFYVYVPIVLTFILLGVFYYSNPYAISIAALCIYIALILIGAASDPTALFKGILIKVIIIVGLAQAIKYGRDYKVAMRNKPISDILDEDFT